MTAEEIKKALDQQKAQGTTDEEILATLYAMYQDDKLTVEELGDIVQLVGEGYELSPEFLSMKEEDKKEKGVEKTDEGVSEKEAEEAKDIDNNSEDKENNEKNDAEANAEDEEEKRARKLYGFEK